MPFDFFKDLEEHQLAKFEEITQLCSEIENELTEYQKSLLTHSTKLRYLRARNYDCELAWGMLQNTLKWVEEFKPHGITPSDIQIESLPGKMYVSDGFDKMGRPIIYMKPGLDPMTSPFDLKLKYLVWVLDQVNQEHIPHPFSYAASTGLSMAGPSNIKTSLDTLSILQNHYPERLGIVFMVNPPWGFGGFWRVVSPFLDEVTVKKVHFIKGKQDFKCFLDHMEEDQLETHYGGKLDFKYDHDVWLKKHNVTPE